MNDVVRFEQRDAVGLIIVNNPPVNALSSAVRSGLVEAVKQGHDLGSGGGVEVGGLLDVPDAVVARGEYDQPVKRL